MMIYRERPSPPKHLWLSVLPRWLFNVNVNVLRPKIERNSIPECFGTFVALVSGRVKRFGEAAQADPIAIPLSAHFAKECRAYWAAASSLRG